MDARLSKLKANDPETARLLYEAAGVYAAHEEVRRPLVEQLLDSPDARVRAFGTHMIGLWQAQLPDSLKLLQKMATDDFATRADGGHRLGQLRAGCQSHRSGCHGDGQAARPLYRLLVSAGHRWRESLWQASPVQGELHFENRDGLRLVLEADGTKDVAALVRMLAAERQLDEAARVRLLILLAGVGTPDDLRFAFDEAKSAGPE